MITSKLSYICWGREPSVVVKNVSISYKDGDDVLAAWIEMKASAMEMVEGVNGCWRRGKIILTMPKEFTTKPLTVDSDCKSSAGPIVCVLDMMIGGMEIYVNSLPPPVRPVSLIPYPCMPTESTPVKKPCRL